MILHARLQDGIECLAKAVFNIRRGALVGYAATLIQQLWQLRNTQSKEGSHRASVVAVDNSPLAKVAASITLVLKAILYN